MVETLETSRRGALVHVPHLDKVLAFHNQAFGPKDYVGLKYEISQYEPAARSPLPLEVASLVYSGVRGDLDFGLTEQIKDLLNGGASVPSLLGFTGLLYSQGNGIYIEDNPRLRINPAWERRQEDIAKMGDRGNDEKNNVTYRIISMDKVDLAKRLKEEDPSVRFVDFKGFETGNVSADYLRVHSLVVGVYREVGASKLSEVSRWLYGGHAVINAPQNMSDGAIRVAAIGAGSFDQGKLALRFSIPENSQFKTFGIWTSS